MVCEWGMSELGPLAFRKPGNAFESDRSHTVSEATAQRVDEEIRRIVIDGYGQAKWIIEKNRRAVEMMAQALLDIESLEADQIKELLERAGARLH
jgi:cell division protease FtsH